MADFSSQLNSGATLIPLTQGVPGVGASTAPFDPVFFGFDKPTANTTTIETNVVQSGSQPINGEIGIYLKDNGSFILISLIVITSPNIISQYVGPQGEYALHFVNVAPSDTQTVTITLTGSVGQALNFLEYETETGSEMSYDQLTVDIVTDCPFGITYDIVSGVIPDGLVFSLSGIIQGSLLEIDCLPREIPSFGLFMEQDGFWVPKTADYIFRVRARAVDPFTTQVLEETAVFRTFRICVQNNWTPDRDNFVDQSDKFNQDVFRDFLPTSDEFGIDETPPDEPLELVQIQNDDCIMCETPMIVPVIEPIIEDTCPIVTESLPDVILQAINTTISCPPCSTDESFVLEEVDESSLCLKDDEVSTEEVQQAIFQHPSNNFSQGLVQRMFGLYVCEGRPTVTNPGDIRPDLLNNPLIEIDSKCAKPENLVLLPKLLNIVKPVCK